MSGARKTFFAAVIAAAVIAIICISLHSRRKSVSGHSTAVPPSGDKVSEGARYSTSGRLASKDMSQPAAGGQTSTARGAGSGRTAGTGSASGPENAKSGRSGLGRTGAPDSASPGEGDSGKDSSTGTDRRRPGVVTYRDRDNIARGTISGSITDTSGSPVPGAQVGLFKAGMRGRPLEVARSGSDGGYILGPRRTGRYTLHVSGGNFAPVIEQVVIESPGTSHDVILSAGAAITGSVEIVDNASISISVTAERQGWAGRAELAGGGAFRIENAPQGAITVKATAPGYVYAKTRIIVDAGGGEVGAGTLRLERGARISGKVVSGEDGAPLEGVSVIVKSGPGGGAFTALSDPEGDFMIDGVPPGKTLSVTFSAPGYLQIEKEVSPAAAGAVSDLHVELSPAPAIHGHVFTQTGEPVALAAVTLYVSRENVIKSFSAPTDAGGNFSIVVPDGFSGEASFRITVKASGFAPADFPVAVGDESEPVKVELAPGCALVGTVLDSNGIPAELASIRAVPAGTEYRDATRLAVETRSGPGGAYRLAGLGEGSWTVAVIHLPDAPAIFDTGFSGGGEEKEKDINLGAGWRFEGTVTDHAGAPLSDVVAVLYCENPLVAQRKAVSDSSGKFSFSGLGGLPYSISLSRAGYEAQSGVEIVQAAPSKSFALDRK